MNLSRDLDFPGEENSDTYINAGVYASASAGKWAPQTSFVP